MIFELKRPQKTSKNVLVFFSFSGRSSHKGRGCLDPLETGKSNGKSWENPMEHLFEMGAMFDYRRLWSDSLSSGWEGASNIILHSPREMGSQGAPHFCVDPSSAVFISLLTSHGRLFRRHWEVAMSSENLDLLGQWSIEFYRYGKLNPNRKTYRKTHYFFEWCL